MRLNWLVVVCSTVLFIAFFVPWFHFPDESLTGAQAFRIAERLTDHLFLPTPGPVVAAYAIYLLPLLALATILTSLIGRENRAVGAAAGLLPIALLTFLWVRVGNELFALMGAGFVVAVVFGSVLLFASVEALRIARAIDRFSERIGRVMYWTALLLVAIGATFVIVRYTGRGFGIQIPGGNFFRELQTLLFNVVFLIGAAFVLKHGAHVRVDLIYSALGARARALIDIVGAALFLIPFCLLGLYLSHPFVMRSWRTLEMSPDPGGLPIYPIKTIILLAFGLLIVQAISEIIKNLAFLQGKLQREKVATESTITQKTEAL